MAYKNSIERKLVFYSYCGCVRWKWRTISVSYYYTSNINSREHKGWTFKYFRV